MRLRKEDFDRTVALLRSAGLAVDSADYSRQDFGSWWCVFESKSGPVRIVWDGRDGWLIGQRPSGEAADGWQNIWIEKNAANQTPETVLAKAKAPSA